MLRMVAVLTLALTLSGCVGALLDAALVEAGAGAGAAEAATAVAARGAAAEGALGLAARGAAVESVLVSDEVASGFRSVRFGFAVRGSLSESLAELTAGGERPALLDIDSKGLISGNGYTVARLSRSTGTIYSTRGVRLGYINRRALLFEYLRSGESRPIGAIRGFVRTRPAPIFSDSAYSRRIGAIPANGIVRISAIGEDGYLVELESGQEGWIPSNAIALVSILGINQQIYTCGAQPGAIVTRSNQLVRYERCRSTRSGADLVTDSSVVHVSSDAISEIWEGDIGGQGNSAFRAAAIHSLRSEGLIYPAASEYTLYPEGDPRNNGRRTPGLTEASQ